MTAAPPVHTLLHFNDAVLDQLYREYLEELHRPMSQPPEAGEVPTTWPAPRESEGVS